MWTSTKATADIARYTAFMSYLTALQQEIEKHKLTDPQGTRFLEQFMILFADVGFQAFLADVDMNKNKEASEFLNKLDGMLRAHDIDVESIPLLRPLYIKMKS